MRNGVRDLAGPTLHMLQLGLTLPNNAHDPRQIGLGPANRHDELVRHVRVGVALVAPLLGDLLAARVRQEDLALELGVLDEAAAVRRVAVLDAVALAEVAPLDGAALGQDWPLHGGLRNKCCRC